MNVVVYMAYEPQVSVNACYGRYGKHTFLKSRARKWKEAFVEEFIGAVGDDWPKWLGEDNISVGLNARFPLRRGQKPDATNFTKLAIDAVAEALGVDDHNFRISEVRGSHLEENGDGVLIYTVSRYDDGDY